jgi:hypothetical protein
MKPMTLDGIRAKPMPEMILMKIAFAPLCLPFSLSPTGNGELVTFN